MELSGKQTNGQQLTFYRTISYQQNIGIRNVSNKTHNYKTLKNSLLIIFSKKYFDLIWSFSAIFEKLMGFIISKSSMISFLNLHLLVT
ncbi:MAG TPA: hypothetical protein DDY75_04925 [Sphingobacterium sp.]|nr:hypothetical protein [Sphingobacterium sp.]